MNPREFSSWIDEFEASNKIRFSEGLREVVRVAMGEYSGGDNAFKGVITPSIVMSCLKTGKARPERDELLASLFRIVGSETFDQMGIRYNDGHFAGPEVEEIINQPFPAISTFGYQNFRQAARLLPKDRNLLLPVDFLVTLTELLPEGEDTTSNCQVLFDPNESFRSLLYRWLNQLSNNPSFPDDLSERLKKIRFSSRPQNPTGNPSTRKIVTPNIHEWLDMSQQIINRKFSSDLKAAIQIAHKGVTGSEARVGVTTPRLLIAAAMVSDESKNRSDFTTRFAKAIGTDRLRKMQLALQQNLEIYGSGELGRFEANTISKEVESLLSHAKSQGIQNQDTVSLEKILAAMLATRPKDCEVFARERNIDEFWREFEGWLSTSTMDPASSDPSIPPKPSALQNSHNPAYLNSWLLDFQSRNRMIFSGATQDIIKLAGREYRAGIPEPEIKGITTASIFLAALKIAETKPNRDHILSQFYQIVEAPILQLMRSRFGNGDMAGSEIDEILNKENPTISDTAHRILQAAASEPSGQDKKILPVDILVSLAEDVAKNPAAASSCQHLVARDESFLSLLQKWLSSLAEAPDFPPELNARLKRINPNQPLTGSSASDVQHTGSSKPAEPTVDSSRNSSERWGESFAGLRNPENVDWSSEVFDVLNLLESRFNEYSSNSKADQKLGSIFQPQLTPRTLFLACLLYATELVDETASSSAPGETFLISLLHASGRTTNEVEEMFFSEFFLRGLEQKELPADQGDSSSLMATVQRANEIRSVTGSDPLVGSRHLITALLHPNQRGGTGALILHATDGIDPTSLVDTVESAVYENGKVNQFDDLKEWEPWMKRLREGLADKKNDFGPLPKTDPTPAAEPTTVGGSLSEYYRDSAGHEIGGSTKHYARAIASTFLSSGDGDFCFALFGPWGRGKSTLIQQVSEELSGKYTSVTFNAWKFPSRPEVWVWLYETLKKEASGDCLLNKLRLGVQSNLREDHGLPLVFPGLLLLFAAIPKGLLLSWTIPVNGIASVIAIALILLYSRRVWNGFGTTLADYLKLPNHGKHLGLQAAIGDDLKRLLATWTGAPLKSRKKPLDVITPPTFRSRFTKCLSRVFCPWKDEELPIPEGRIAHVRHLLNNHWWFSLAFVFFWISLAIAFGRIGPHATLSFSVAIAIVSFATIAFYFAILMPVLRSKTVLLVVDDLDRCPPEEMLAVIESLRVFLDDPEISPKLKIAMLLDREILSHAVCRKYEKLLPDSTKVPNPSNHEDPTGNKAPDSRFTTESIVAEQIEKFFLLSFDLPPLESKEAWDIAEKIVGKPAPAPEREAPTTMPKSSAFVKTQNEQTLEVPNTGQHTDQPSHATSSPPISPIVANDPGKTAIGSLTPTPEATKEVVAVHLTSDEQIDMIKLLHSYLSTGPGHPTPRHMRMTKMRYFLARQILTELGSTPNPTELMKHFGHLWIDRQFDSKLAQVVGMVTGRTPDK